MYSRRLAGQSFLDAAPPDISALVAREVFSGAYAKVSNPRQTLHDAVRMLRSHTLEQEQDALSRAIHDAQRRGDTALVKQLFQRQIQTRNQAGQLKRRPEEDPR